METRSTRIREHVEDVVLRLGSIKAFFTWTGGAVGLILGPVRLPFGLEKIEGVRLAFLGHDVGREGSWFSGGKHAKNALKIQK